MTEIVTVIGIVAVGLLGAVAGWLGGYQHGLRDYDRSIWRGLARLHAKPPKAASTKN